MQLKKLNTHQIIHFCDVRYWTNQKIAENVIITETNQKVVHSRDVRYLTNQNVVTDDVNMGTNQEILVTSDIEPIQKIVSDDVITQNQSEN